VFLDEMDLVVPWLELVGLIATASPVATTGRPPFAHETMLRIHFLQQWFSSSDLAMEGSLFETPLYGDFVSPQAASASRTASAFFGFATCLKSTSSAFKYWLPLNNTLTAKRLLLKCGMVIDVTLIAAPSSTKNSSGERGPEMHQTKKGSQWHFGNKALIVVDADSGLVHSAVETAANVNDVTQAG